jgi:hypothetical protein
VFLKNNNKKVPSIVINFRKACILENTVFLKILYSIECGLEKMMGVLLD